MQDPTIAWLILVCGSFGALIALLVHAGGAMAFGQSALKITKSRKSSLLMTFVLGVVIFIDDYLNALTVGETMKRVTDKYRVSREMLAYVVDSTAAPICVLIPLSTWAVFFSGLIENTGSASVGEGITLYIQSIPYMLYAWFAVLMVLLVCLGIMPNIGPMKKAEFRAHPRSAGAMHVNHAELTADPYAVEAINAEFANQQIEHGKLYNFMVPILLLVGSTIYFGVDIWKGLLVTLTFTIIFFSAQKLIRLDDMMKQMFDGFQTMLPAIGIVIAAFMFKAMSDMLGMPQYVIQSLMPFMSPALLPAIIFVAMAILAFATGSSWGVFAVTIPIVMPLAHSIDANIPLVIGALLSASSFGSQACFYSDSTVLAAQGSGCDLMGHALTQLPYALIAAFMALISFLVLGFYF